MVTVRHVTIIQMFYVELIIKNWDGYFKLKNSISFYEKCKQMLVFLVFTYLEKINFISTYCNNPVFFCVKIFLSDGKWWNLSSLPIIVCHCKMAHHSIHLFVLLVHDVGETIMDDTGA